MHKTVLLLLGLGLVFTLAACQQKIPLGEARADWAGYWVAPDGSNIQIWPDGSGDYRSGSTRVTGAAARFEGKTLTIKMMGIGRTFAITEGPHMKGEQKVIVLDGVEYVKRRIP